MKCKLLEYVLSCVFLFLVSVSASGQSFWEVLPLPDGGHPDKMVEMPDGVLFASIGDTLVYRSDDQGQQWHVALQFKEDILYTDGFGPVEFGQDGSMFRAWYLDEYYTRTIRSVDGGATWQTLLDSSLIYDIVSTTNGFLLGLTRNATQDSLLLVRSVNGGATWNRVYAAKPDDANQEGFRLLAVEHGGVVCRDVVGTTSRCLFSFDEGLTWRLENGMPANGHYLPAFTKSKIYLVVSNFDPSQKIIRIDSSGASTVNVPTIEGMPYFANRFLVRNDGVVLLQAYKQLLASNDDGKTWQVQADGQPDSKFFPLQAQTKSGTILANVRNDLFRSVDNGQHWGFAAIGMSQGSIQSLTALSPDTIIAKSNFMLFKTTDAGLHWTAILQDSRYYNTKFFRHTFVVTKNREIYAYRDSQIMYSPDLGQHFFAITPPDGVTSDNTYRIIFFDEASHAVYVNTQNGVMHSADIGLTWESVSALYPGGWTTPSQGLSSLVRHPSGVLFACDGDGLMKSSDNGHNWIRQNTGFKKIFVSQTGELVAVGFMESYHKSIDAGQTWIEISNHNPFLSSNSVEDLMVENIQHHWFSIAYNNACYIRRWLDGGYTSITLPDLIFINAANAGGQPNFYITIGEKDQKIYASYGGANHDDYDLSPQHFVRSTQTTANGALIKGTVTRETDDNCDTYELQNPLKNWIVQASGANAWYTNTDSAGRYAMFIDTGSYIVSVKPPIPIFWQICQDSIPVQLPTNLDTTLQRFSVKNVAQCPYMFVNLAVPHLSLVSSNPAYLEYYNKGAVEADSAWVDVTIDSKLRLTQASFWNPFDSLGNQVYRFHLGHVAPGQQGSVYFNLWAIPDSVQAGETHCISAHIHPDSVCIPIPAWNGAEIVVDAKCEHDTAVQFRINNIGDQPSQTLHYIVVQDDVVMKQGNQIYLPNQPQFYQFVASGHTWRFESQQEPGHPFSHIASATIEGCNGIVTHGLVNMFDVDNGIPSEDVECVEVTSSFDPNDKKGFPEGYGTEHFIEPKTPISYHIDFQNTGTEAAQLVVVRDTLDPWLDPASLRMGAASHPFTWRLDGKGYLTVQFAGINLPDSNANEAGSHGFFSYTIGQKAKVPLGTVIHNTANIYFDFNSAVQTNQTTHTIGHDFIKQLTVTHSPQYPDIRAIVAPNPVAEEAMVTLQGLPEGGEYHFHLTDSHGRVVQDREFTGNQFLLRRENLPATLYFFQINDQNGQVIATGKVVIQ